MRNVQSHPFCMCNGKNDWNISCWHARCLKFASDRRGADCDALRKGTTMKNTNKGFTLVEIMIVVAIIAILAAIAIPNFLKYRTESRKNACIQNMKQLQTAAESWRTAENDPTGVPAVSDLVGTESTKFIRKEASVFTCPEGGDYTISTVDGGALTVSCGHSTDGHNL